jgi:hypothetical protein
MVNRWLIIGLLLLTFVTLGCIAANQSTKGLGLAKCEVNRSYTEEVPYTDVEFYTEQVPYSEIEYYLEQPYEVQEPYTEKECTPVPYLDRECSQEGLAYSAEQNCYISGWLQNITNVECKITNLEPVGGSFIVYYGFMDITEWSPPKGSWYKNKEVGENETVYLYPHSSKNFAYSQSFKYSEDMQYSRCYCYAQSLSTKEVCKDVENTRLECREVTKYRTVTEYKPIAGYATLSGVVMNGTVIRYINETRSRSVVKYRTETRYETVEEAC